MPHEITSTDGAVFAITPAWHGLGETFPTHLTPLEAKQKANLGWSVSVQPAGFFRDGIFYGSPEHAVIVRDDINTVLGVASHGYPPFTNDQVFEAIEKIYGVDSRVIESAFSIKGGKRVIALVNLAQANVKIKLVGGGLVDDPHASYHAFSVGHTGKDSCSIFPTMIRIVCNNTWNLAAGRKGENIVRDGVKIRHSSLQNERWQAAVAAYRQAALLGEMSTKTIQKLALAHISNSQFRALKDHMIDWALPMEGVKANTSGIPSLRERRREELHKDLENASALTFASYNENTNASKVNAYLALNAVTMYSEHELGYKGTEIERKENEFESRLFGKAADWRDEAFSHLMNFVEATDDTVDAAIMAETARAFSYTPSGVAA
jgi:phage/plasmid-like protein (TIGR03299 family)